MSPRAAGSPPTTAAAGARGVSARAAVAVPLMHEQRSDRASAFAPRRGSPDGGEPLVARIRESMLHVLSRHRVLLAVLVTSTLFAAVAAKLNTSGNLQIAAATTHVMVDVPDVPVVERLALTQDLTALQKRAELYARLIVTPPVVDHIARRAGLPPGKISAVTRTTADVPIPLVEPGSEERASQIEGSRAPYRLEVQSSPAEPTFTIYAAAPTTAEALELADSAVLGVGDYLRELAAGQGASERRAPVLRQLGAARGGLTNAKARIVIAG